MLIATATESLDMKHFYFPPLLVKFFTSTTRVKLHVEVQNSRYVRRGESA